MTKALHKSTQDLINTIERKDRIFRISQAIFMSLLIAVLIGVILLQSRTLNAVQQQLVAQKDVVAQIKKDNSEQLGRLNRHLDCIAIYFQQSNRAQLTIDDINKCTLSNGKPVPQFFSEPVTSAGSQSTKAAPANNQPAATQTNQTSTVNTGSPSAPASNPPVTVLGVPICVPFKSMCLRN